MDYRRVWSQVNGPIPKDEKGRSYEIHHVDGNRKNNSINNLMCVSIQEHYNIHYSQGDWAAVTAIAKRMGEIFSGWAHTEEAKKKMRGPRPSSRKSKPPRTKDHIDKIASTRKKNRSYVDPTWLYSEDSRKKGLETKKANGPYVAWNRGLTLSEETRQKISKAKKGTVAWTKPHSCVVCGDTKPENFIARYKSKCKSCVGVYRKQYQKEYHIKNKN